MDTIEVEGKNVEDAVKRGLERLGLPKDRVRVEVLEEAGGGILSLFTGRRTRVRLTAAGDETEKVRETVEKLLRAMQLSSQVTVEQEDDIYQVRVDTAGADGLLIGRKGDTLNALQHLIDRMVNRGRTERIRVAVDVGSYRRRRIDALRSRALALAGQVKATGREQATDPLHPPDRRVVHLALSEDPAVRTYTVGEGTYRTVVIAPAESRSGAPGGQERPPGGRRSRRLQKQPATIQTADNGEDDEDD